MLSDIRLIETRVVFEYFPCVTSKVLALRLIETIVVFEYQI